MAAQPNTARLIVLALDAGDRMAHLAEMLNEGPNSSDLMSAIEDYQRFSRQLTLSRIERSTREKA